MTGTQTIQCMICGKEEKIERKTLKFYLNWLEYEPEKWLCRNCKDKKLVPRLLYYKLQFLKE